jgi:signal transduction histidine kinase
METVEKRELNILSEISRISNSAVSLQEKLQRITQAVARGMEKDGASLFLIDSAGLTVTLSAAVGLNQESIGKLRFPLGKGVAGWVAEQKVPLALEEPYSDPRFAYVPESGIERFKSLAAAPILDEDRCLGVLFVLSAAPWRAATSDITLLTTTANQISGVIRSAQLFENIQQRLAELATIYEIGMALTATLDLDQLLTLIAKNTTRALRAQGCAIRLQKLIEGAELGTTGSYGLFSGTARDMDDRFGRAVADRTVAERKPLLVRDVAREPAFAGISGLPTGSLISVPLIVRERVIGVITLYNREEGLPFTETDLQFLATIGSGAAVAIDNASMYERMEGLATEARSRAQELSILYDIGTAMSTTLNLDRLLRIILTAATMGGTGLGFNRAILLLTNERTRTLQGMMGVGPTSWEEAGRAWSDISGRHKSLMEWIQSGELFDHRDSEFNTLARSIRAPLDPREGVLALTALEKKPYQITDAASSPLVPRELREMLKVNSFATVPLVAKDKAVGVIVVDNLFTQRPITDRDIRFLTMFAHQAALAVENAIIHSNLETLNRDLRAMHEQLVQSEKMAALGAMMTEITHEIRNPLVSLGGFARRLARKIQDEDAKKYIDIILGEVTRLEGIIQDHLSYIKDLPPRFREDDLNVAVQEMLALYEAELDQKNIRIEKDLAPSLPPVMMDAQQIKQALINITKNAVEVMPAGGVLGIRTSLSAETDEVLVEISDTGPGISETAIHNIFDPYYTTKELGTGLGLTITNRIVNVHKGRIEVRNKETGGAVFTVRLPAAKK